MWKSLPLRVLGFSVRSNQCPPPLHPVVQDGDGRIQTWGLKMVAHKRVTHWVSPCEANILPTRDDKQDKTQESTIFHLHCATWSGTLNCWGSLNSAWSNATLGKPPEVIWMHVVNGLTLCVCELACTYAHTSVRLSGPGLMGLQPSTENQWPTR